MGFKRGLISLAIIATAILTGCTNPQTPATPTPAQIRRSECRKAAGRRLNFTDATTEEMTLTTSEREQRNATAQQRYANDVADCERVYSNDKETR
jgi:nitrous oxide reductase accessory protein NosL